LKHLFPSDILLAADLLKEGVNVAFPTETVYGLGARVFDVKAVENIFRMKGRPSDNPLICHIAELGEIYLLAREVPEEALKLAEKFWPGPLTIILKKQEAVPSCVTGGHDTVAIRMPRHPIALELIKLAGEPLVAPSANKSGRPSSTTAAHVLIDFEEMEGAVIDGGATEEGIESTVLYLAGEKPVILRPGVITQDQIAEVLGCAVEIGSQQHASPGTRYRHYSPKAKIQLFSSFEEVAASSAKRFLMSTEKHPSFHHMTSATLYALLRQADDEGCEEIIAVYSDLDEGLKDRLLRAAGAR
jgi:L-threonylcarbamoyladenylate synthase